MTLVKRPHRCPTYRRQMRKACHSLIWRPVISVDRTNGGDQGMLQTNCSVMRCFKSVVAGTLFAATLASFATASASALPRSSPAASTYVALGDSYSSGEGLAASTTSYIPPSNDDGCHRSVTAFPVVVAADLNLDLSQFETYGSGGFVACSGATSKDLLNGEDDEPSQLSALSPETRWVTVTDGGDDLHFSDVLIACLDVRASAVVAGATRAYTQSGVVRESSTCADYLASADSLLDATDGTSKEEAELEHVYEQIFVHAPNAELAVLNYPQTLYPTSTRVLSGRWRHQSFFSTQGAIRPIERWLFAE